MYIPSRLEGRQEALIICCSWVNFLPNKKKKQCIKELLKWSHCKTDYVIKTNSLWSTGGDEGWSTGCDGGGG